MLGIFGGTFDPIHYGHIKPALHVKEALNLSALRFIPNHDPPHRETPWLTAQTRLELLKTALQEYPEVFVDNREIERDGPSYMVDTLVSLHSDFPDERLCLIIGMDAFLGLTRWHRWRDLFALCHLVVTTRPGFQQNIEATGVPFENDADEKFIRQRITTNINDLSAQATGQILLQLVPQLDVSSTQIRANLRDGVDISQWVPKDVYRQISRLQTRIQTDDN